MATLVMSLIVLGFIFLDLLFLQLGQALSQLRNFLNLFNYFVLCFVVVILFFVLIIICCLILIASAWSAMMRACER